MVGKKSRRDDEPLGGRWVGEVADRRVDAVHVDVGVSYQEVPEEGRAERGYGPIARAEITFLEDAFAELVRYYGVAPPEVD